MLLHCIQNNENVEKKGKKCLKTVELPVTEVVKAHTASQLNNLVEREAQMVQADKLENERINAKVSHPSTFAWQVAALYLRLLSLFL